MYGAKKKAKWAYFLHDSRIGRNVPRKIFPTSFEIYNFSLINLIVIFFRL